MKLLTVDNIQKKDIPLHYRNEFSGQARFLPTHRGKQEEIHHQIEFAIERSALGKTEISVKVLGEVDYPLVPLIKSIKTHIIELQYKGLLP